MSRCLMMLLACVLFAASAAAQESPLSQGWEYAAAMRGVAARGAGRAGVVLHVGDSITYASPYGAWARAGEGRRPAYRRGRPPSSSARGCPAACGPAVCPAG